MIPLIQSGNEVASPAVAVRQQERALPSISKLPTELLNSTLLLALPDVRFMPGDATTSSHEYFQTLYTIRRVAKRWQEIIDGTPSFWTIILSTLPPHVNNTIILRSAKIPLTVVYDEYNLLSSGEFLPAITHTRHRWSAVVLHVSNDASTRGFLASPAPLLHTIILRSSSNNSLDNEPPELLGGQTSNLRHVDIAGASIRWKMGLFTQLKALSLSNVVHNGFTTSHIIDFLRASPCLEELWIDGDGITPDGSPSSQIITLPYLKSIVLPCDSGVVAGSILRQIQAPCCSEFIVNVENGDGFDPISFINEALKPFERILREFHVLNGASFLSIDSYGFAWQCVAMPGRGRECSFELSIGDFFDPLAIRWVERILQNEPGLQIDFGPGASLNQAVFGVLASMRCVTTVTIGGQGREAVRQIFHFLNTPLSPRCLLPSLPCLRDLSISSTGWSAQDLLDMVQIRFSAFSWSTMDRPNLTIKIRRRPFTWSGNPRPMLDFVTLSKIRGAECVESLQFDGPQEADGTLAITWNEEASEPTWG